jgi:hypothetical protein
MVDSGELLTLAEIAVAFAGFSALVTALGGRASHDDRLMDSYALRTLVENALVVATFSLLPIILQKYSVPDSNVWRISSAGFILVTLMSSLGASRRARPLHHLLTPARKVTRRMAWPMILGSYVALILVATGLSPVADSALYFTALCLTLGIAGLLFRDVVASVFASPLE